MQFKKQRDYTVYFIAIAIAITELDSRILCYFFFTKERMYRPLKQPNNSCEINRLKLFHF
jgi:hypothetical protein